MNRILYVRSQGGEGKIGCLFFLAVVISFVYIGTRALPVYLDKIDFEEGMARIASQAGVGNWSNEKIIERVRALARAKKFDVSTDRIRIRRPDRLVLAPEIKITVPFERAVEFPGYLYTFHFETNVSSLVGTL